MLPMKKGPGRPPKALPPENANTVHLLREIFKVWDFKQEIQNEKESRRNPKYKHEHGTPYEVAREKCARKYGLSNSGLEKLDQKRRPCELDRQMKAVLEPISRRAHTAVKRQKATAAKAARRQASRGQFS